MTSFICSAAGRQIRVAYLNHALCLSQIETLNAQRYALTAASHHSMIWHSIRAVKRPRIEGSTQTALWGESGVHSLGLSSFDGLFADSTRAPIEIHIGFRASLTGEQYEVLYSPG